MLMANCSRNHERKFERLKRADASDRDGTLVLRVDLLHTLKPVRLEKPPADPARHRASDKTIRPTTEVACYCLMFTCQQIALLSSNHNAGFVSFIAVI